MWPNCRCRGLRPNPGGPGSSGSAAFGMVACATAGGAAPAEVPHRPPAGGGGLVVQVPVPLGGTPPKGAPAAVLGCEGGRIGCDPAAHGGRFSDAARRARCCRSSWLGGPRLRRTFGTHGIALSTHMEHIPHLSITHRTRFSLHAEHAVRHRRRSPAERGRTRSAPRPSQRQWACADWCGLGRLASSAAHRMGSMNRPPPALGCRCHPLAGCWHHCIAPSRR
eukprot:scaffold12565_cov121-Isochrysis_galbana.AAC.7